MQKIKSQVERMNNKRERETELLRHRLLSDIQELQDLFKQAPFYCEEYNRSTYELNYSIYRVAKSIISDYDATEERIKNIDNIINGLEKALNLLESED